MLSFILYYKINQKRGKIVMNFKKKIVVPALLATLILPNAIPAHADSPKQKEEKVHNPKLTKEEIKNLKEKVKYVKKTTKNNDNLYYASVEINGVEAVILMNKDAASAVTDEMIQQTYDTVNQEVEIADTNALSTNSESYSLASTGGPSYIIENPGSGTVIGTRNHTFSSVAASTINTTVKSALAGIATGAGYIWGPLGASAAAAVATAVAEYVEFKPSWSTTKLVEYYSDRDAQYLVDEYCTTYKNSARTTLDKVFLQYGVPVSGSKIG